MSDKPALTLDQFTRKVSAQAPNFTKALKQEQAHLRYCAKIREDLKRLREDMGMKQSEVAEQLEMSQPAVSRIENGEGDIGLVTLCRYAAALGMEPTISFAPAASTYGHRDHLARTVRAIGKLSETRLAAADSSAHDQYRELAAIVGGTEAGVPGPAIIPGPAIMGAMASAMSGAITQSLSTEIASMMSAFSGMEELGPGEAPDQGGAPEEPSDVAAG
ncbi:helix-turn-helix domain-containing protein [Hoeflea olei]|uniref:HTH cro/C1-type domain-containing protein n=1 Tax=Hoeflea olei TaxID=1480615 RepID=A0A1C1YZN2_9HYPH|nr:helix-turn-helix transcriptional regulator [Hoeflea olei]OCW58981.1 hypothetical protein AWJ14_04515 [Hoeflea olei]